MKKMKYFAELSLTSANLLKKAILLLVCFAYLSTTQISAQSPLPITFKNGRIALSHDGNKADKDDIYAVAMQWAIFSACGMQDKLVHVDVCDNLGPGGNSGAQYQAMLESLAGRTKFPGFTTRPIYFDDQTQLLEAIANFKKEAEAGSADNILYFLCSGPMEVPWRMINAVSEDKRKFIHCISHSSWNNDHTEGVFNHTWASMVKDFGPAGTKFTYPGMAGLGHGDWSFLKNMPSSCIPQSSWNWLLSRALDWTGDGGSGDCSDDCKSWFVLTGDSSATLPEVQARLMNPLCSSTDPAPVANFSTSSTSITTSGTVDFTDNSTGSPTSWSWSFPGGTPSTSTSRNPSVTYAAAGVYSVTLTATNSNGTDSVTKANHITVTAPNSSTNVTTLKDWVSGITNTKVAGANRLLTVMVMGEHATSTFSSTGVTYGGQAMTKVTERILGTTYRTYVAIFTLKEAGINAATSGAINVAWSGVPSGSSVSSIILGNVDQTTPIAFENNALTGTVVSTTALAAGAGDMVLMGGATSNNTVIKFNNGFIKGFEANATWGDATVGTKLGTSSSATQTPSFTQSASGRMVICAIVAKKASASSARVRASENDATNEVRVYPNPTSDVINIEFSDAQLSKEINVLNAVGQLVYSLKTSNSSAQINVQSLNLKGVVVVQVNDGKSVTNHKVIVN